MVTFLVLSENMNKMFVFAPKSSYEHYSRKANILLYYIHCGVIWGRDELVALGALISNAMALFAVIHFSDFNRVCVQWENNRLYIIIFRSSRAHNGAACALRETFGWPYYKPEALQQIRDLIYIPSGGETILSATRGPLCCVCVCESDTK